jgi:hypothetical protein
MEIKAFVTKTVGTVGAVIGAGTLGLKEILSVDILAGLGETGVALFGLVALVGSGALALDYAEYLINDL